MRLESQVRNEKVGRVGEEGSPRPEVRATLGLPSALQMIPDVMETLNRATSSLIPVLFTV